MSKKIIAYVFIVIMLCLISFLFGYAKASQTEVGRANSFITDFMKEYPCAAEAQIGGDFDYSRYGLDIENITWS